MTDLDSMSHQHLVMMRVELERAIARAADRERVEALKAAEAAAREQGVSLANLMPLLVEGAGSGRSKVARTSKAPSEARFRNPEDHGQTWLGRSRRLRWFNEAQAAGRAIQDLKEGSGQLSVNVGPRPRVL